VGKKESIMLEVYPEVNFVFENEYYNIEKVIELISKVRNIRGEYNVPPSKELDLSVKVVESNLKKLFDDNKNLIKRIARVTDIHFIERDMDNAAMNVAKDYTVFIPLGGLVDIAAEIKRLEKEKAALEKDYKIYGGKLQNENYLKKAPAEVVEKDKQKFEEIVVKLKEIENSIKRLEKLC